MNVKFEKLTPDLMVNNVAASVKYYCENLGFDLAISVPEGARTIAAKLDPDQEYVYAMVRRDEVFIMFMRRDVYAADVPALKDVSVGASASLYCEVEGLDAFYRSCRQKGLQIVKDISSTWYGMKEFYVQDPDGYILAFAESVQQD